MQELKKAFDLFDNEKTGKIDRIQLKIIMKALNFEVSKEEISDIMNHYDINQTGDLEYKDFIDLMTKKYAERDPIDEIKYAFKLFVGDDPSGKITV